jgi:putative hemolysin
MTAAGLTLLLCAIAFLISCSALFSGLETALFALKNHQIQRLHEQHPSLADFLRTFRENPRSVLNVLLLGGTLVNVPLVILCLVLIWEGPLPADLPSWVAALAIFAVVVLICDLMPKLIALSKPYRLSTVGVFTLKVMMPLLDRVGHALESVSTAVIDRLTPAQLRVRPRISDEELETLVEMGEEEGTLQEAEGEMIQEIIKLGDKTAKDCMTPRVDTFAVPDDLPNDEAIALFKERRHRRVPVYAETPDQIAGIVDVKQFLLDPARHYTETLIPPSFVPETMRAMELLRSFLSHPQGLAIVVDEFGGTEGIITLADIIEEIISDAAPLGDAELYIEPLEDGRLLVSGNARLDDLTEHLGFELIADGIDTIGGYLFNRLGFLPNVGAKFEIPRLTMTVRRMSRKRIEEVLLEKTTAFVEEDAERVGDNSET